MRLYRSVPLPSDEPVQFVGVYVLHWGTATEATMGFVPIGELGDADGFELHHAHLRNREDLALLAEWLGDDPSTDPDVMLLVETMQNRTAAAIEAMEP